jgi:hypothetical protein
VCGKKNGIPSAAGSEVDRSAPWQVGDLLNQKTGRRFDGITILPVSFIPCFA